jgi:hypothetical protein
MITCLEKQLHVINTELLLAPNDLNLLKSQMEVEHKLELAKFHLMDVVEVKTTANEGMAFSNAWRTYRENGSPGQEPRQGVFTSARPMHNSPA